MPSALSAYAHDNSPPGLMIMETWGECGWFRTELA